MTRTDATSRDATLAITWIACIALAAGSFGQSPCPGGVCPPQRPVQWQQPQGQQLEPSYCDVTVHVQDKGGTTSIGSGTTVARHPDGGTIILTNNHVVEDRASDTSITIKRGVLTVPGRVLATEAGPDLAAILVEPNWKYIQIGTSIDPNATLITRGFPGGRRFVIYRGRVSASTRYGHFLTSPSYSGMSGGGVFQNDRYVGIVWGGASDYSAITSIVYIRPFLDRILGSRRIDVIATPKPQPAPPQTQPLPPRDCDCADKFSKIDKLHAEMIERLNALEANASKVSELVVNVDQSIDQRIDARVEQRIAEIKFPECPKPDTSGLELRINTLESQLAEMKRNTPVSWDIVPKE